jgi:uncharacterized DUF497 family protein
MAKWNDFVPAQIEYDFEKDKLHIHKITIDEAAQCFFNTFQVRKNKKFKDRFKLFGFTDSGRQLCIIFQLKRNQIIRVITGWEV